MGFRPNQRGQVRFPSILNWRLKMGLIEIAVLISALAGVAVIMEPWNLD